MSSGVGERRGECKISRAEQVVVRANVRADKKVTQYRRLNFKGSVGLCSLLAAAHNVAWETVLHL